ncbi:helix-turn-helix domain-containing protein [Streptosporangium sp. CA-135522]|uniref:helix-turn-helix domain-containing protein n=1 Tax=Streptosporangium sp. CA-135522 TaxID=3240072 RepID=UPI003D8B7D42
MPFERGAEFGQVQEAVDAAEPLGRLGHAARAPARRLGVAQDHRLDAAFGGGRRRGRRGSQTASRLCPIWDNDHIVISPPPRPTIYADVTLCADESARVIPFVLPLNVPEESMSMTVREWLRLDERAMMVGTLDQSAIIARLRALRLARGLTVQYLADQTGIHRSIIGKLERGQRKTFNLDEARALCDALKVDLRMVISDEPMVITTNPS